MRELGMWDAGMGIGDAFSDVEAFFGKCKYSDCKHQNEPGCAVRESLNNGKLEIKRWESWLKLQKELAHLEARKEGKERLMEKQWGRQIAKFQKEFYKGRI